MYLLALSLDCQPHTHSNITTVFYDFAGNNSFYLDLPTYAGKHRYPGTLKFLAHHVYPFVGLGEGSVFAFGRFLVSLVVMGG